MADPRFFHRVGPFSLAALAEIAGATLAGDADPDMSIEDVAPLERAGAAEITFLDNRRYLQAFAASRAAAAVVDPRFASHAPAGMALLTLARPYRAYALIARAFYPPSAPAPGLHPRAVVAAGARIAAGVAVAANAVIESGAEIGARTAIGPGAVVHAGVVIGADTIVGAGATLSHCLIGARVLIHPGVRIGQRGFGFAMSAEGHLDVPQLGRVIIGDDVEIGANSTIDRGAGPDTVIGAGAKIDNLVQIGHNVRLGEGCVLVSQSGVAGSTSLGDFAVVAAQGGIAGHLTIGPGAQIGAQAGVMRDVPAGAKIVGSPAVPVREFFRQVAVLNQMARRERG